MGGRAGQDWARGTGGKDCNLASQPMQLFALTTPVLRYCLWTGQPRAEPLRIVCRCSFLEVCAMVVRTLSVCYGCWISGCCTSPYHTVLKVF